MGKGDLLKKRKESRKKNAEENKGLKFKKNWYPVSDIKGHFKRKCKIPKKTHISAELVPGQVVILLSGRFRGRRVVFLKKLESGLLLVTGPYKYNGVPLKRVNAAYVLPTNTKLKLDGKVADSVNDKLFLKTLIKREKEEDFFVDEKTKRERITEERKKAQNDVDTQVKKAVDEVPMMKEYLRNRFALKSGDKPHLMKF
jgi:large subunit ribosomal protein L6e